MGIVGMAGKAWRLILIAFIFLSSSAYAQTSMSYIKSNPDGSQTLLNNVPREVALGLVAKIGPADLNQMLDFRIMLPTKDPAGLANLINQLYDPKSPVYHKFLTHQQVVQQFGANTVDSSLVIEQLKSHGLSVYSQSDDGCMLRVNGSVAAVKGAFNVNINNYKGLDGNTYFSPDVNPTIPPQIAGKINAIIGLDNMHKYYHHSHYQKSLGAVKTTALPAASRLNGIVTNTSSMSRILTAVPSGFSGPPDNNNNPTVTPSDLLTGYNLNSVSSKGAGQTQALFELDGFVSGDITQFTTQFNLTQVPPITVVPVNVDGTIGIATPGDGIIEVDLDIDLTIALAPALSSILVYEADQSVNPSDAWVDEWDRIKTDNSARIISCSWGLDEPDDNIYDHTFFDDMALQGQTVFASAGDEGAYDNCTNQSTPPSCGNQELSVDDPASYTYVTGVGISILSVNGSQAWSSETASAQGGGGISGSGTGLGGYSVPIPSFQTTAAANASPSAMVSTTKRNVPDVVLNGDPAAQYLIYSSFECTPPQCWYTVWGSSAAAPLWGAFMSRVNQGRIALGESAEGWVNPALYQIAQSSRYTSDFHDITTGSNSFYPAKANYDDATGLGTFNGLNLYNELLGAAAPTGVAPISGGGQIVINWTASSGAVSYNVKRSTTNGGPYTTVSTSGAVTTATYTDTSVTSGTTYYYVISAVNAGGIEGPNSSQSTIIDQGLSAPTGVMATAGNAQVSLTWTAIPGAVSYNVKRSTTTGGPYTTISTSGAITTTNYTDSSVTNGTAYFYVVSAVNSGGESSNSSEVSATPLAPPLAPTGLMTTPGNTQVSLAWTASATAASYNVKRATVSGGPYTTVSTSGAVTGPSYTDNGLTNGTLYYYVISAVNVGGESPNSSEISTTPSVSLPIAPTGLIATPGNAQVVLAWTASATATSYNVKRSTASNGPYLTVSTNGAVTTTNYTDSSVTNGGTYYYVVSAVNGSGEGANSSQVSAAPLAPPSAPTGLNATEGNTQVSLTWSASATAASYNVKRATISGGPYTTVSTSGAVTTTNYTDTSLTNGTTYFYVVSAVNVGGESANSTQVSATPVPPIAPPTNLNETILGARVGGALIEGGVILTWVQSTDPTVIQNKIYRSVGAGSYSLLATVSASTSYTDKNTTKGTTYNYKVTAYISGGFESSSSNPVTVNY